MPANTRTLLDAVVREPPMTLRRPLRTASTISLSNVPQNHGIALRIQHHLDRQPFGIRGPSTRLHQTLCALTVSWFSRNSTDREGHQPTRPGGLPSASRSRQYSLRCTHSTGQGRLPSGSSCRFAS